MAVHTQCGCSGGRARAIKSSLFTKMQIRSLFVSIVLMHGCVLWCDGKHIALDASVSAVHPDDQIQEQVQHTIKDLLHRGIYSHTLDPSQAEVVTPVKVTRDGELVTRAVDHAHGHGHARARRDLAEHEHEHEHTLEHDLHYNLTVGGRDLRLDLRPSVSFITPSMVVERHTSSGRTRNRPHPQSTGCHYTGTIRGQTYSTVALSACDGLAGLLRTEDGEFWIEPSNRIPTDGSKGRPHLVFKRAAVNKLNRAKREVDRVPNNNNLNRKAWQDRRHNQQYSRRYPTNNHHGNRAAMDQRRRQILEARRKRLELMRTNPYEYRRQMLNEQRRLQALSRRNSIDRNSSLRRSNSTAYSQSIRNNTSEIRNRSREHNSGGRWSSEQRQATVKPRKRRRRRVKNCGTKQPRYQWKNKNEKREANFLEHDEKLRNDMTHRRRPTNQRSAFENSRRSARSISKPRHVEVLLVADRSMTEFHDKGNLETYLLTIMNLVSTLYMDPSIGNYIKVVVVKIILVEGNDATSSLDVSTNADATLASFCRWQHQLNPNDDTNPHHHDVAILVTRQDICSLNDTPCSTLGVAHVAGMCKPDRSCSVNEDNGITLAHTITHELGHNFGLYHDTEKIGCHRREGTTLHIMTPIFEADTAQVAWSRCSKRDVTNFLDSGLGECLGDKPSKEEYEYPSIPAGMLFDAGTQCHLQFGAEAQVCAEPAELCEHLWCVVNNTCKTMLRPAAPGTTCGPDMWCQNQKCVPRTPPPRPQDGGWGGWGSWSECSRTCGAGVSTQSRECNTPEPSNNGRYCIGERSRYKVCNTDPCPMSEPTFREVQCSKYDNVTYSNETNVKWVPYYDQDKPCELMCMPHDQPDVEMVGGFVTDGTPCRQSLASRDMCIAGVCHRVGCDWVVGSSAMEDACGVCGGDGSHCKTVQGMYTKSTTTQSGFSEVAVIPAGSRNVKIQEKVNPGNYIAIGSAKNKRVYLNGARNITLTEYLVAGSPAIYERDRDWEKVRIVGPITEDIKVYQRILRGKRRNPGVTYQYTVDRARGADVSSRRWFVGEWSGCSRTCGRGTMLRHLVCRDARGHEVDQSQCYHMEAPHVALMQQCRLADCPHVTHAPTHTTTQVTHTTTHAPHTTKQPQALHAQTSNTFWWFGAWSACTPSCHMPGHHAMKQRNVYCVDKSTNKVIEDTVCEHSTKPTNKSLCMDVPPC